MGTPNRKGVTIAEIEIRRDGNAIDAVLLEPEEGEDQRVHGLAFYYERGGVWAVAVPVREKYRHQGVEAKIIDELLPLCEGYDIQLDLAWAKETPFPEDYVRRVYEELGFRATGKPERSREFSLLVYTMTRPANQPTTIERSSV